MKKSLASKFFALLLMSSVGVTSCYDDSGVKSDINQLKEDVSNLKEMIAKINSKVSVNSVVKTAEGYIISFSDGSQVGLRNGIDGKDGADGKDGRDGQNGLNGRDGKDGVDGKDGADGKDGRDGQNGLNGRDGKDGVDGKDGKDGIDGKDGVDGKDGKDGIDGKDGVDGKDGKDGADGKVGADAPIVIAIVEDETTFTFTFSDGSVIVAPKTRDISNGKILNFGFKMKDNSANILYDLNCDIEDTVVSCRFKNIIQEKTLIPSFTYQGVSITCNGNPVVSGETMINFSTPVTLEVTGSDEVTHKYLVEVHSFTGLPIVYIETEDSKKIESKDEYLNATVRIVEDLSSDGETLFSECKVKGRGNSTWTMAKKPYKIKFDKKTSVLGMPKDKEWVLLANYSDKTQLRNETAFYLGRQSNLEYTCRTRFVELFINGVYNGTYQLGEQQKISEDRVNVGKTGYLLEIDAKYDKDEDIVFKAKGIGQPINIKEPDVVAGSDEYNLIADYVNTCGEVLMGDNFKDPENGYAKYLDVESFVDWFLINEISRNNDAAFYTSCYMHYQPGGKLVMGPLWDFDIAFGNVNYNNNFVTDGAYISTKVTYYKRLFQDPAFVAKVKERFDYFYSIKDDVLIKINENYEMLKLSAVENNSKWKTLYTYTWPNYAIWGAYENEVTYMKNWFSQRMDWLKEYYASL